MAEHAKVITLHLRTTSLSIADIGRRLILVRTLLGDVFQNWIRAEFQWSIATARDYMLISERFGHLDCLENFQPSAVVMLGRKYVPEAAISLAISKDRSGLKITKAAAREIVDRTILDAASVAMPPGAAIPLRLSRSIARDEAENNQTTNRGGSIHAANRDGETEATVFSLPATTVRSIPPSVERKRVVRNVISLIGYVKSVRDNLETISKAMTHEQCTSLADELADLAQQLRTAANHDSVESDDEMESDILDESEFDSEGSEANCRELATV